ncbi:MAG: trypsin-like peptidase domain-containing protein [Patescibacteria group bacterium]
MYTEQRSIASVILVAILCGSAAGALSGLFVYRELGERAGTSTRVIDREASSGSSQPRGGSERVEDDQVTNVVKRVSPAVVSISIAKTVRSTAGQVPDMFQQFFGQNPFFEFQIPRQTAPSQPDQKQIVGGGSGFLVSADGMIVTNKHVVADAEAEYTVIAQDGKKYPAKILATDPAVDLAILKIEATGMPYAELGDSKDMEVGQTVIAIGYALAEFKNTVTKGVISGVNRRLVAGGLSGSEVIEGALQTDAAINHGNSGGPLINLDGRVIGVNTAISANGQSLGFALPVNLVKRDLESVKRVGKILRPWLGVRYVMLDEEYAKRQGIAVSSGALIAREEGSRDPAVVPTSPADKAGLQENDIILELNQTPLDTDHSLSQMIGEHDIGDEITLKVLHQGKEKLVQLTLEERKM